MIPLQPKLYEMNEPLLTRTEFREGVFARDKHQCVNCGAAGQDAHHIIERRLFTDGGYYTDNGATLCGECHMEAETTRLDCETVRAKAGIGRVVLPPDFYSDTRYDKWGNVILEDGTRLRGPLFDDESVQKVLAPVLHLFTNRVKYPRTFHLPWSPGTTEDDKMLASTDQWLGMDVVFTEKMDGENTTMYRDGIHARSIEFAPREDRDRIKALHAEIAYEIPDGMRVCGENLTAVHSIRYAALADLFMVYSIWQDTTCLSWAETVEWCQLLGLARTSGSALTVVPLLYQGLYSDEVCQQYCQRLDLTKKEGLVVRPSGRFQLREFPILMGKFVREKHVRTQAHWTRRIEYNSVI